MKTSIWDILTGILLLSVLCLIGAFGMILVNPNVPFNPFPPKSLSGTPQTVNTPIVLPSPTETFPGLPPTFTPTPIPTQANTVVSPSEATKAPAPSTGLRPSSTPVPTNTPVMLPTFTPSKTARSGVTGGSCEIVYQDPKDGTFKAKGTSMDVRWTIKNTSSDVWRADSVDIKYVGGDRMHSGNDLRDMPYDVGVNGMLDLVIPMTLPANGGTYVSNWSLVSGSKPLCNFFIQIRAN
jgi:hypothetical protein